MSSKGVAILFPEDSVCSGSSATSDASARDLMSALLSVENRYSSGPERDQLYADKPLVSLLFNPELPVAELHTYRKTIEPERITCGADKAKPQKRCHVMVTIPDGVALVGEGKSHLRTDRGMSSLCCVRRGYFLRTIAFSQPLNVRQQAAGGDNRRDPTWEIQTLHQAYCLS